MLPLKDIDCGKIIGYKELGFSIRKIEEITGIPKSTVCDFLKIFNKRGSIGRKRGSGRLL
jgi:predicted transcriptional regulator